MNLSAEQFFALEQMGIPVWISRQEGSVNSAEQITKINDFSHIDFTKSWLVIAETAPSAAETRLLRAIFGSINIKLDEVAVLEPLQLKALESFSADSTFALVLGEGLSKKFSLQPHTLLPCQLLENKLLALTGPGLQQLMQQPQRKSELWQIIIQLRNLKAAHLD